MPRIFERQVLSGDDKQFVREEVRESALDNGKRKKEVVRLHRLLEQRNRRKVPYSAVDQFCQEEFGKAVCGNGQEVL